MTLAKNQAAEFGVIQKKLRSILARVQARKEEIVNQLHQGVQGLMKKGKIDVYEGTRSNAWAINFFTNARNNFC